MLAITADICVAGRGALTERMQPASSKVNRKGSIALGSLGMGALHNHDSFAHLKAGQKESCAISAPVSPQVSPRSGAPSGQPPAGAAVPDLRRLSLMPRAEPLSLAKTFKFGRVRALTTASLLLSDMSHTARLRHVCAKAPKKRTIVDLEHVLRPIQRNAFLQKLPARKQMQVAKVMRFSEYEEGAAICRQGDKGDLFYILVSGGVRVCVCKENDMGEVMHREIETTFPLSAGCSFGELALLSEDSRRSASIVASRFCQCLTVGREDYLSILYDVQVQEAAAKVWDLLRSAIVRKYYEDSVLLTQQVTKNWHKRQVTKGSVIIRGTADAEPGPDTCCLWYIVSGNVAINAAGPQHADRFAPKCLAQLGPTQFFGLSLPSYCAVVALSECSLLLITSTDLNQKCDKNFAEEISAQARLQCAWWEARAASVATVCKDIERSARSAGGFIVPRDEPQHLTAEDPRGPKKACLARIGLPKLLRADKAHGAVRHKQLVRAAGATRSSLLPLALPSSSSTARPMTSDQRSARFRAFLQEGDKGQDAQVGQDSTGRWNPTVFQQDAHTPTPLVPVCKERPSAFRSQWWVARSQKEFEIPAFLPLAHRQGTMDRPARGKGKGKPATLLHVNSLLREYGVTGLNPQCSPQL